MNREEILPSLRPPGPSRLHEQIEVGDASLDECRPGVVEEMLDSEPTR
ncbi:hypothetical protein Memar_0211 [Methanoculleus marisnigri JR1]|uniref:Uncharacterized protein n=1 Tax=Methanoculleus marisnigri (strain ATCC 35101 / DSM 1498 / JR1) TaxID=368407 RepID=A3CRZ5_METMJ|nr:hypothetical protein Memar_0211 [Methanoculleus marisnigri JR1]